MLELKQISAGYGSKTVIENFSYSFEAGKIYTILGKNGCGKSTLLKTCAAMLPISSGQILLHQKPLNEYPPLERAREISYLSQHRNTPSITVERLLMHGRHPHMSHLKKMRPNDWKKIEEVMEIMEISHFRHTHLSALSGGERQRVYVAMLLAQDTPIILLDEPTIYMDIAYQLDFLEQAKKLKAAGKTLIMVLHDLNHALQLSDEVILMENGTLVTNGTPEAIISSNALMQVFGVELQTLQQNGTQYFHMLLHK